MFFYSSFRFKFTCYPPRRKFACNPPPSCKKIFTWGKSASFLPSEKWKPETGLKNAENNGGIRSNGCKRKWCPRPSQLREGGQSALSFHSSLLLGIPPKAPRDLAMPQRGGVQGEGDRPPNVVPERRMRLSPPPPPPEY